MITEEEKQWLLNCGGPRWTGLIKQLFDDLAEAIRERDEANRVARKRYEELELLDAARAELAEAKRQLDKWRPLTTEEAQKAYDEAVAVPVSEEEIERIVKFATDPANTCANSEQMQMVVRIKSLNADLAAERETVKRLREPAQKLLDMFKQMVSTRPLTGLVAELEAALAAAPGAEGEANALEQAARNLDIGMLISCVEEREKQEPGPWARPHIESLNTLMKARAALAAAPAGE